jgi:hypothetical protein
MKAVLEIRAQGAPTLRRDIGAETLVIGRNPRAGVAGIAVPTARDLADEHLIVSFVRDRFHVALASGARLEPALHGRSFRQADVAFGEEVIVGNTSIRFLGKAKRNTPNPILTVALLSVLGLSAWTFFDDGSASNLNASSPAAPPLFDPEPPCPYAGTQALGQAQEAEQAAMAHGERYSFDAYEGVSAVISYRAAAACYGIAGDPASAARARAGLQRWQTRIEGRYQGHQLRLRVALDRGRNDNALNEVRSLKHLLRGKNGPYESWLDWAERKLQGIS